MTQTTSEKTEAGCWFAEDGEIYITFKVGSGETSHIESHPLKSPAAQGWIRRYLRHVNNKSPTMHEVENFTNDLMSKAYELSLQVDTFLRVGWAGGKIYVDLGMPDWKSVEIDEAGWRIIQQAPVAFRRNSHMHPLPMPEMGGSLELLNELINFPSRMDYLLYASFLVNAFNPMGAYFHLMLIGEKGSAKSSAARLAQKLIHPSSSALKGMPRDEDNLVIAAFHNRLVMIDNENDLGKWLPNALCRLATGTGMSSRALYTNRDQMAFTVARPAILTAHAVPTIQTDLIERSIIVNLQRPEQYVSEKKLNEKFNSFSGKILGALFDAISQSLANQKLIPEDSLRLHRMADASYFIACAFEKIGWQSPQDFLMAIEGNQFQAIATISNAVADDDPLVMALVHAMEGRTIWEETPSTMLEKLKAEAQNPHALPKTPNVFSRRLGTLRPHLFAYGLMVKTGLHKPGGKERLINIVNTHPSDTLANIVMENPKESAAHDDTTI